MRSVHRAIALVVATSMMPVAAFAQSPADKATARTLGQQGQEALDRKDFTAAEDRFNRADALYHAPTLSLGIARAQAGLGHFVAAQETYNRIVREGAPPGAQPAFVKAIDDARAEVAEVSPKIGEVVITIQGAPDPTVLLDDAQVPAAALGVGRSIDPGPHVLKASAPGRKPAESPFSVGEGAKINVDLTLQPDTGAPLAATTAPGAATAHEPDAAGSASSRASTQRLLGIIALSVGGAGVVVGGIGGILALGKQSDLEASCKNGVCGKSQQSNVDSYGTMQTLTAVGFIVGAIGVGGGLALLVTAPKKETASARVTPFIGPGSIGASGTF